MKTKENGALIVEATFVFPIMFFVIFFLIYMGNMFYMRSRVDALVSEAAVHAAAYCRDPLLGTIEDTGGVPDRLNDIQPYHMVLGGVSMANPVRNELEDRLDQLGSGYFYGMNLRECVIDHFDYHKGILTSTFTVAATYRIKFPIRFLGSDRPTILRITSESTVPVTDTPEFILDVDMAMDFWDRSALKEKLSEIVSKVSEFLGH